MATRSLRSKEAVAPSPEDIAEKYALLKEDPRGFAIEQFADKGRGIVAKKDFNKGDFLLQYYGEIITKKEGDERERQLSSGFRFFFPFKGTPLCIDATDEPSEGSRPMLGRLVNHGEKNEINSKMKISEVEGQPLMALYALKLIKTGQEILYDYGFRPLPWKTKTKKPTRHASRPEAGGEQTTTRDIVINLNKSKCMEIMAYHLELQTAATNNNPDQRKCINTLQKIKQLITPDTVCWLFHNNDSVIRTVKSLRQYSDSIDVCEAATELHRKMRSEFLKSAHFDEDNPAPNQVTDSRGRKRKREARIEQQRDTNSVDRRVCQRMMESTSVLNTPCQKTVQSKSGGKPMLNITNYETWHSTSYQLQALQGCQGISEQEKINAHQGAETVESTLGQKASSQAMHSTSSQFEASQSTSDQEATQIVSGQETLSSTLGHETSSQIQRTSSQFEASQSTSDQEATQIVSGQETLPSTLGHETSSQIQRTSSQFEASQSTSDQEATQVLSGQQTSSPALQNILGQEKIYILSDPETASQIIQSTSGLEAVQCTLGKGAIQMASGPETLIQNTPSQTVQSTSGQLQQRALQSVCGQKTLQSPFPETSSQPVQLHSTSGQLEAVQSMLSPLQALQSTSQDTIQTISSQKTSQYPSDQGTLDSLFNSLLTGELPSPEPLQNTSGQMAFHETSHKEILENTSGHEILKNASGQQKLLSISGQLKTYMQSTSGQEESQTLPGKDAVQYKLGQKPLEILFNSTETHTGEISDQETCQSTSYQEMLQSTSDEDVVSDDQDEEYIPSDTYVSDSEASACSSTVFPVIHRSISLPVGSNEKMEENLESANDSHSEQTESTSYENSTDCNLKTNLVSANDSHSEQTESTSNENSTYCNLKKNLESVNDSHSSEQTESTSNEISMDCNLKTETTPTYKKPYRFCIFCDKYWAKLSNHIVNKHKDVERVKVALTLPKQQKDEAFDTFKKEGIWKINKMQARQDNPNYEREKTSLRDGGELIQCGTCQAFLSKKYIKRHKKFCGNSCDAVADSVDVPVKLMSVRDEYGQDFIENILSRFKTNDEAGQRCINDECLMEIGRRLWSKQKRKVDKHTEVRKSVMADMRRLATLYIEMRKTEESLGELPVRKGDVSDLFHRQNFRHLEEAVDNYTTTKESNQVKAGLKQVLLYVLKTASKIVKALYLMDDNDVEAESVDKFMAVLELNQNQMFGDATYLLNKQREEKLRRPQEQPEETDIEKLKQHTIRRMNELARDQLNFLDSHSFVELRDCVVARLTLYNARRGGEPSRLFVSSWLDADKGVWLDKAQMSKLDPLDKALAKKLKVGYQTGKGKHFVPVLFPQDTHQALRTLADKEVRQNAGVSEDNKYLFPVTNGSPTSHVSGWHAVNSVCEQLPDLINRETLKATKNRHRISVLFALSDVPERERGYIYKHLGHSEETNVNIYQAPLAVKEVTVVGRRLETMDSGQDQSIEMQSTSGQDQSIEMQSTSGQDQSIEMQSTSGQDQSIEICHSTSDSYNKPDPEPVPVVKPRKYTHWKKGREEDTVKEYFKEYMDGKAEKRLPGKRDVEEFLTTHPELNHDWKTVHVKVMNEVSKRERLAKKRLSTVLDTTN